MLLWVVAAVVFISGAVGSVLVYRPFGWNYFDNRVVLLSSLVLALPAAAAFYLGFLASPPGSALQTTLRFMSLVSAPFLIVLTFANRFVSRRACWRGIQTRGTYPQSPDRRFIDAWALKTGRLSEAPAVLGQPPSEP